MPQHTLLWNSVGSWTTTAISRCLAAYAILQGTQIVLFDEHRWSGPAFKTANELWGSPDSWGVILAVAGLIALIGSVTHHMLATSIGHLLAAIWSFFFAVTLLITAVDNPGAATTGIFVYGALAVVYMLLSVTARQLSRE